MAIISSLFRYPVKGLSAESLPEILLKHEQGVVSDRIYAIENGAGRFDANEPKWLPKINFLMLMRHERLAGLVTRFNDLDHSLTIFRDGKQVARGTLNTKLGRQLIEQFFASYMEHDLKGPPRIVFAEGHQFTDIAAKAVHLVNLETVKDLARVVGEPLDPLRFRANVYFEGVPAWTERQWVGKKLMCGDVELKIFKETQRCEATSVDPVTAIRGLSIPSVLERTWNHMNLGFYAKVVKGGRLKVGDTLTAED